jgi:hypothetical protein
MMPFAFVRPGVDPAQRPKASQNKKRDDYACMRAATIDDDQRSTLSVNAIRCGSSSGHGRGSIPPTAAATMELLLIFIGIKEIEEGL